MRRIWQQDVLRYLTNRNTKDASRPYSLRLSLKLVRAELALGGDPARLSTFVNRKRGGAYDVPFDAVRAFDKLIQPLLDSGKLTAPEALRSFREYLRAEDILDEWTEYADYRECLIAAFTEGWQRQLPVEADESPRLHSQRFPEQPFFVGREQLLEQMQQQLRESGVLILTGLGGIGKTVLAREYAFRNQTRYERRQLIVAEPGMKSWRDLLLAVRFDNRPLSEETDRDAVLRDQTQLLTALDSSSLLIFDTGDSDLEDYALFQELMQETGADIILTTRLVDAYPEGSLLEVGALPDQEQLQLLSSSAEAEPEGAELEVAAEICRRIGGHTFLIQLLGRAARTSQCSFEDLLSRLEGLNGFAALEDSARIHKDAYNRTEVIIRFVSELLFSLAPLEPETQEMLRCLTLLPLSGIPRQVLLGPLAQDAGILADLERRGLVQTVESTGVTQMHPVIREAILAQLEVDSNMCTPLLYRLDESLWMPDEQEPSALLHLLMLAASAVDMLYISDPLRALLTSGHLEPLFQNLHAALAVPDLWAAWQEALEAMLQDETLSPEARSELELYGYFCELQGIIEQARHYLGGNTYSSPFLDIADVLSAVTEIQMEEQFTAVATELTQRFFDLHPQPEPDVDPAAFYSFLLSQTGDEFAEFMQEEGATPPGFSVPRLQTQLSESDLELLRAISELPYRSFLETALEALSDYASVLPFIASPAVATLTLLFILLQTTTGSFTSLADVSAETGWQFPDISGLSETFSLDGPVEFSEPIWGRPQVELTLRSADSELFLVMERFRSEGDMHEFSVLDATVIEDTPERTILETAPLPGVGPAVQVHLGDMYCTLRGDLRRSDLIAAAKQIQPAASTQAEPEMAAP